MNTRLQNFCGYEKYSPSSSHSISGTPVFSLNMTFPHSKYDITSSGTSSLQGTGTNNVRLIIHESK